MVLPQATEFLTEACLGALHELDGACYTTSDNRAVFSIAFNEYTTYELAYKALASLCYYLQLDTDTVHVYEHSKNVLYLRVDQSLAVKALVEFVAPYTTSAYSIAKLDNVSLFLGFSVTTALITAVPDYIAGLVMSDGMVQFPTYGLTPHCLISGSESCSMVPEFIEYILSHVSCTYYTDRVGKTNITINDNMSNYSLFKIIANLCSSHDHLCKVAVVAYAIYSIKYEYNLFPNHRYDWLKEPVEQLCHMGALSKYVSYYVKYGHLADPTNKLWGGRTTKSKAKCTIIHKALCHIVNLYFKHPSRKVFVRELLAFLKTKPKYKHLKR